MWFLLMPLVSLSSFCLEWMRGFRNVDILNRRLDWMMMNVMTTAFLTGFKPLFMFLKNLILFPIHLFIGFSSLKKKADK